LRDEGAVTRRADAQLLFPAAEVLQ
jgi:hypothetical protein